MIRIWVQPMRSWTRTQEGFSFFLLGGGGGGVNVLCSHYVPMCSYELPMCFPWVLHDVLQVPNEFPKGVRNSISVVWPLLTHIGGPKGRDSISTKQLLFWKASQVSVFVFFFLGNGRIKPAHCKHKIIYSFSFLGFRCKQTASSVGWYLDL